MATILIGVVILLFVLLFVWYKYLYAPFQVLKRLGIPHPPVTLFTGNLKERILHGTYAHEHWIKAYGKVVGFYIGAEVRVIIADLDMLKEITVKQFDIFPDRVFNASPLVEGARKVAPALFDEIGQSWKRRRTSLTPSFSSKKLKMMAPLIEKIIDSLCERIDELSVNNASIEFHKVYSSFTMETILATAFGTKVSLLKGEGHALSEAADGAFKIIGPTLLWSVCLLSHFPLLLNGLVKVVGRNSTAGYSYSKLIELATMIVKARREQVNPPQEKDFLQVLLESGQNEEESYYLTDADIVGTCIEFIIASHDTTTNCLSYTSYLLALNPDKQDKLRQLIQDYYQENKDASLYEAAHSIPYLEWVIHESMRRFAPATRTMRYCKQTCTVNGVTIPKGSLVVIPIQYIHHCPEYWEEPYAFKPERFSPEEKEGRNPLVFMPFGWGPRSCIGARFALMELKMTLLSVLRKYRFERAPDTEIPMKTVTFLTQSPANGVYLNVSKCS